MGVPVSLQTPVVALGAVDELPDLHRTRPCEGRKSGVQAGMSVSATVAEPTLCGGTHSSSSLGQMQGDAGRLARLSGRWGVGVPWSQLGANEPAGAPRRARCARSARSGEPATPRSHRPRCAGSATLKHLNSGSYRWVCPASPPSPMRVPIPEPSSPSLTPFAPPRLFGGHFDDFPCAAGGTKCYIGALGTS